MGSLWSDIYVNIWMIFSKVNLRLITNTLQGT